MSTAKLNTSKLGTRKYWEEFYDVEKNNFKSNKTDLGESWFSDADAEHKMVDFLSSREGTTKAINYSDSRIGDLGTGNGRLLFALRDGGFMGPMIGLDYSQNAIDLANGILRELRYSDIEFRQWNFLTKDNFAYELEFDILLDKGTLDAIALSGKTYNGSDAIDTYVTKIQGMMNPGGIFFITSCNFTEQELTDIIAGDGIFAVWDSVTYPSFSFGGQKGQTVCSVAFQYTPEY